MISFNIIKLRYLIALAFACTLSTASWGGCQERKDDQREISSLLNDAEDNNDLFLDYLIDENDMEEALCEPSQVIPQPTLVAPDLHGEPLFAPMTPALLAQLGLTPCTYADLMRVIVNLSNTLDVGCGAAGLLLLYDAVNLPDGSINTILVSLAGIHDHAVHLAPFFGEIFFNSLNHYNNDLMLVHQEEVLFEAPSIIAQYPLLATLYWLWHDTDMLRQRACNNWFNFSEIIEGDFTDNDVRQLIADIRGMIDYIEAIGQNFDMNAFNQHEDAHDNGDACWSALDETTEADSETENADLDSVTDDNENEAREAEGSDETAGSDVTTENSDSDSDDFDSEIEDEDMDNSEDEDMDNSEPETSDSDDSDSDNDMPIAQDRHNQTTLFPAGTPTGMTWHPNYWRNVGNSAVM